MKLELPRIPPELEHVKPELAPDPAAWRPKRRAGGGGRTSQIDGKKPEKPSEEQTS